MLRFGQTGGQLLLIDCAGTERRQLGQHHVSYGIYRVYIGIMEKKMETTIMGYIGAI